MTPEERKAVWHELEQKYLPARDYDGCEIFEKGAFFFEKLQHTVNQFKQVTMVII